MKAKSYYNYTKADVNANVDTNIDSRTMILRQC